jgi:hypothetical protein
MSETVAHNADVEAASPGPWGHEVAAASKNEEKVEDPKPDGQMNAETPVTGNERSDSTEGEKQGRDQDAA